MPPILGDPDALVAEVIRRAQQKSVEVEAESNRQISAILEQAQEESDSVRAASEGEAAAALAALERRSKAQGELEAQRRFTALREASIDHVWVLAEDRLRQLTRDSTYSGVLKHLATRAAVELGQGPVVLAADPAGHALLTEDTLQAWSAEAHVEFRRAPDPSDAWGGLMAACGRMRINLTFPDLLTTTRASLRERVFEILARKQQ